MHSGKLSSKQQELVDLLRNELAGLLESGLAVDQGSGSEDSTSENDVNVPLQFTAAAGHAETMGGAAELVGLSGIVHVCEFLDKNFATLSTLTNVSDDQCEWATSWLIYLLAYFQYLDDDYHRQATIDELVGFLEQADWPHPLSTADLAKLRDELATIDVSADDGNGIDRVRHITTEMASLSPPDDVQPELLDSLLVELPEQSREFSEAIDDYLRTRSREGLIVAQRLAHTVKGAANVVGVPGVANLMHYSEDILQEANKIGAELPAALAKLLAQVADCLEASADYLLGTAERPDDTESLLQSLLNWSNDIAEHGLSSSEPRQIAAASASDESTIEIDLTGDEAGFAGTDNMTPALTTITTVNNDATQEAVDAEIKVETDTVPGRRKQSQVSLRVSDELVGTLLEINGEHSITNTQLTTQSQQLRDYLRNAQRLQANLNRIASDLEHLIEIEGAFSANRHRTKDGQLDSLEMERYNELHSYSHQIQELTADAGEFLKRSLTQVDELNATIVKQHQLTREDQQLLLRTRMISANTLSSRLHRCVRQANRLTGKNCQLAIHGDDVLIDSRILNELVDPLMHLLRNAVDHGIENVSDRQAANKTGDGQVSVEYWREGEFVVVKCRDDGRGLDWAAIEEKARANGLLQDSEVVDEKWLQQCILQPGFTTRTQASQVSGRGVGLDAVNNAIQQLKGQLSVESTTQQGTCFSLRIPATLISSHALLAKVGDQFIAVTTRGIEQIIFLQESDLMSVGGQQHYKINDSYIPTLSLASCTSRQAKDAKVQTTLLVVSNSQGRQQGITVDSIVSSRDMVIKPLSRYTPKTEGVIGATILGDGTVAPVLDLTDLIDAAPHTPTERHPQTASNIVPLNSAKPATKPMALVVDDSLSARRALAQFVQDIGMDVRTAKDGFEAINVMEKAIRDQTPPRLLLVDLEMPRMNGLELTSYVRSHDNTRNIPIIMITSRTTDKHRELAAAAGVNTYLNKPFSEDELLGHIQAQIA